MESKTHGLPIPSMSPLSVGVNIHTVIALLSDLQNAFWLFVAPTCNGNVYKKV